MRSFVFATAFLSLMLFAAVCPPATQAAPATLTVNFEVANPAVFWATKIDNTTAVARGNADPAIAERVYFQIGSNQTQPLTPKVNSFTASTSSEYGSEVLIEPLVVWNTPFTTYNSGIFPKNPIKLINNGQTVTITVSVKPTNTDPNSPKGHLIMTAAQ